MSLKFQGYINSEVEAKPWTSKDGSRSGVRSKFIFVANVGAAFAVETWHDPQWCAEHGICKNQVGDIEMEHSVSPYGYNNCDLTYFRPASSTSAQPKAESPADGTKEGTAPAPVKTEAQETGAAALQERVIQESGQQTDNLPF